MKILITGANGFLGQHLCQFLTDKGFQVVAIGRGECKMPLNRIYKYISLDLTNVLKLHKCLYNEAPTAIIHTAAMSKPDECEAQKELSTLQNIKVTEYLLQAAEVLKAHFIFCSTDFVFGDNALFKETDEPEPINFYGQTKFRSEQLVQQSTVINSIIRPVFMYGNTYENCRPSFVQWVQRKLSANENIQVVDDQIRTPTYVKDVCNALTYMVSHQIPGIFHLAGQELITPYQLACKVAYQCGLDQSLIQPVTANSFSEIALRPKNSQLDIQKAKQILCFRPTCIDEGLRLSLF